VVGEVGFPDDVQARNGAHEVVVDPEAAHCVVDRWKDPHWDPVGVLIGDAVVHLEEIAIPVADGRLAQPPDGVGKIQVHSQSALSHSPAFVANFLGGAGGDIARSQVAEAGVLALEVVVALSIRNLRW